MHSYYINLSINITLRMQDFADSGTSDFISPPPSVFFLSLDPCAYRIMHDHEFMQVAKRNAVFTVQPLFLLANCIKNEVMLCLANKS